MLPGKYKLEFWRGAPVRLRVMVFKDPTLTALIGLSGYTAHMDAVDPNTNAPLLTLTTENGGLVVHPEYSAVDILISDDATRTFPWSFALYELFLVTPNGSDMPLVYGSMIERSLNPG
jgi:hypothetical protein